MKMKMTALPGDPNRLIPRVRQRPAQRRGWVLPWDRLHGRV